MKKRFLAMLLAVAMIIGFVPHFDFSVNAAYTEITPDAGAGTGGCGHDHSNGWTEISSSRDFPNSTGKYYLSADVTLNGPSATNTKIKIDSGKNIEICLNGHTLLMSKPGANSTIDDSEGTLIAEGSTITFSNGIIGNTGSGYSRERLSFGNWSGSGGGTLNFNNIKFN